MKDYATEKIRNVCLLGHGGTGKTSLAEAMMFNTGVLDRLGKIADGTTYSDYDNAEIKRSISIGASLAAAEWKDTKINILDTPGYFDFAGEVVQAVRVADTVVIVLSGKDGLSVGAEKAWAYATEKKMPVIFYINRMDEENANFDQVMAQLHETYGNKCVAFSLPVMEGEKLVGTAEVLSGKAYKYDKGKATEMAMPADLQAKIEETLAAVQETVAETDEALMEKYFAGEAFTQEELQSGLQTAVAEGYVCPVLCGSATENIGTDLLMNFIADNAPAPSAFGPVKGVSPKKEELEWKMAADEPFSALVFKTIADPFVGKISFFKVMSGTAKGDVGMYIANKEKSEKTAALFTMIGKKQVSVSKLAAGDIGAVAKLQLTETGDTLCTEAKPILLPEIKFPKPMVSLAIEPKTKGDEDKIGTGLSRLQDEDRTFKVRSDPETKETIISGIGEQHLDIIVSKMKDKYKVEVNLKPPKIAYREAIRKPVRAEGKHKKQSGGAGQFGHVFIEFEPSESEELIFEEKIFGGAVPKQYFPAVEKGLNESIKKGVLAGYPVVNLKATLVDGKYHDVDSSEMAFKLAAILAFKSGMADASPMLLEPIMQVEVLVPDSYMGDIIGDLNKRRGRILGMNPQNGGIQQVVAEVPETEMFKYATDLRSITQARGEYDMHFVRYEQAPDPVAQKVIQESQKEND